MDYNYLRLRLQTFRREYFDISGKWLKSSWSWLIRFTIDNFKYLYLGEIHQIKYLSSTVRQQREYIDRLNEDRFSGSDQTAVLDLEDDTFSEKILKLTVSIIVLPLVFLVYWVRRIFRIITGRRFELAVSEINPTEDMVLNTSYQGKVRSLYLIPARSRTYPRGLVILRYSIATAGGSMEPYLYIDPGIGFTSEYTIPLPWDADAPEQEMLLELPPRCKLLKLEAAPNPINIEIKDISIKESNFIHAAWYLKRRYDYGINEVLHALFIRKLPGVRRTRADKTSYPVWHRAYAQLSEHDIEAIARNIAAMNKRPLFSIIIHTDNDRPDMLDLCIKALMKQIYRDWELLVTCAEPPDAHVTAILNDYNRNDIRIRMIINKQMAGLLHRVSDAVKECHGQYIIFLEYKDLLTDHAIYLLANQAVRDPDAKLIYSDFDHIDQYGALTDPVFKPDWNYDFFLGKNYILYLTCYEREHLISALDDGISNPFLQASQLNIRVVENLEPARIIHIPYVLLHHRIISPNMEKGFYIEQQHDEHALNDHLNRTAQPATALPVTGGFRIKRRVPDPHPLVSLVVLTRDRVALLSNCIHGLLDKTSYNNIEIIIVDNGSTEEATAEFLDSVTKNDRVKVLQHPSEFNFSELNNFAAEHASGEYIGLINNDISVIESLWLEEMMSHLLRDEVGVVGAKLLYENNTIQHAGVVIGLGGVAGHHFRHEPRHSRGYDDRLLLCQELSCVTAACLVTKKQIYHKVGGLDAVNIRIAFNDVDYCLKVRKLGYKVIWTPFAELYHLESASRGPDLSRENIHRWNAEYSFMRGKWEEFLDRDPFYNPNLAITDEDFSLAHPPRLVHPWERFNIIPSQDKLIPEKAV